MGNVNEKLRIAVYQNDIATVRKCLDDKDADTEWKPINDLKGNLIEAEKWRSKQGEKLKNVKMKTISENSPINEQYCEGTWSALQILIEIDHVSEVQKIPLFKLLLEAGAIVNCEDEHKQSALDLAVDSKQMQLIQLLLDFGADPNHKGRMDYTALVIAGRVDFLEGICLLLDRGADPNLKDFHGFTVAQHLDKTSGGSKEPEVRKTVLEYLNDYEKQKERAKAMEEILRRQREYAQMQQELLMNQQRQAAQARAALMREAWAQAPAWQPGLYEQCYGQIRPI